MRRNRRAGVEDRWTKIVRDAEGNTQKLPTARHGQGKRWLARWVDADGREQPKCFSNKRDAESWLATEVVAPMATGCYVAPRAGQVTVGELHAKWVGTQGHLKATTVATREYTWARHVEGRWSGVAAADVRTSDVRSWVADMTAAGAGAATVENALSVLRQILAMAVEDRRIARNPCAGVKVPRRTHRPRGYLTHEQVELLARAVGAPGATVVRFLAYSGLRWGEMAALRVSDFDMLRRRVHISRAVAEVRGKIVWSHTQVARAPLGAVPGVPSRRAGGADGRQGPRRSGVHRRRMAACCGYRLAPTSVRACGSEAASDGGCQTFPRVTPHDLRHTAARLAISAGANVKAVQTMLGHAIGGAHAGHLRRPVPRRPGDGFGGARRCPPRCTRIVPRESAADRLRTGDATRPRPNRHQGR